MKYNVHVYHVVRTKVPDIEASSHEEAMKKADELFANSGYETESAEEVAGYLVDEQGDGEFASSRSYGPDYQLDDPSSLKKSTVEIIWGESPDEEATPSSYSFDTEAELNAFLLGVAEMDGWLGYETVDEGEVYCRDCKQVMMADESGKCTSCNEPEETT